MSADHPTTNGGRLLKRGDTFDPECPRTSHRLKLALRILAVDNIVPEWDHSQNIGIIGTGLLQRDGHVCDYRCKAVWPEYATGTMFDLAYQLANEFQTERGRYHQRQINAERAARVSA